MTSGNARRRSKPRRSRGVGETKPRRDQSYEHYRESRNFPNCVHWHVFYFMHRDIIDRQASLKSVSLKPVSSGESGFWVRLFLNNAEANAVRVDKDRITSYRLFLSLSPSLQTDVATYRADCGLSPLSIISL